MPPMSTIPFPQPTATEPAAYDTGTFHRRHPVLCGSLAVLSTLVTAAFVVLLVVGASRMGAGTTADALRENLADEPGITSVVTVPGADRLTGADAQLDVNDGYATLTFTDKPGGKVGVSWDVLPGDPELVATIERVVDEEGFEPAG